MVSLKWHCLVLDSRIVFMTQHLYKHEKNSLSQNVKVSLAVVSALANTMEYLWAYEIFEKAISKDLGETDEWYPNSCNTVPLSSNHHLITIKFLEIIMKRLRLLFRILANSTYTAV